jgi:hypothetical protein
LLEINRSPAIERAIMGTVLAAVLIVPFCGLPAFLGSARWAVAAVGAVIAVIGFGRAGWLDHLHRPQRAVVAVRCTHRGQWRLSTASGVAWDAFLQSGSHVAGRLIWLRFTSHRGPFRLLLWGRGPLGDTERRLLVRLKLMGLETIPAQEQP